MTDLDRAAYRQDGEAYWDAVHEAIKLAEDQDRITWLADDGRRIAAIVPAHVAGAAEAAEAILSRPGMRAAVTRAVKESTG